VGRSKTRAYAYLTHEPNHVLTETAEKRLKVLGDLDSLGAGFQLASHDLDIRGAGNLVGDEQSGHIKEVGFELYQSMLEEAILEARAGAQGLAKPRGSFSPQITIDAPILIPEDYVPDLSVRMALYRRLNDLEGNGRPIWSDPRTHAKPAQAYPDQAKRAYRASRQDRSRGARDIGQLPSGHAAQYRWVARLCRQAWPNGEAAPR
jgi:hypothetical protein